MGSLSIWHWVLVAFVVLLLFGRGKIPALAKELTDGIKALRSGLSDDSEH